MTSTVRSPSSSTVNLATYRVGSCIRARHHMWAPICFCGSTTDKRDGVLHVGSQSAWSRWPTTAACRSVQEVRRRHAVHPPDPPCLPERRRERGEIASTVAALVKCPGRSGHIPIRVAAVAAAVRAEGGHVLARELREGPRLAPANAADNVGNYRALALAEGLEKQDPVLDKPTRRAFIEHASSGAKST
jgi:hypothetical protein